MKPKTTAPVSDAAEGTSATSVKVMRSATVASLTLLEGLGIPVEPLATGPWRARVAPGIHARYLSRRPFQGGRDWRSLRTRADAVWGEHLRRGRPTYGRPPDPPGLLRLADWSPTAGGDLLLGVQPTWYWSYLGSNVASETSEWSRPPILAAEARSLGDLRNSTLANPLTVNVAVVAGPPGDRSVLIQHRGRHVANVGERFQISGAGYVDGADFIGPAANLAWNAGRREILEETGAVTGDDDLTYLALCRMRTRFTLGLCGVAYLPARPHVAPAPQGHDRLEIDAIGWWPWTASETVRRVRAEGGWATFVPLGAAALAIALAAEFGADAVLSSWRQTRGPS